ncbi:glutamine amidotransferase [Wolbachia endosymbiont of Cruorifilaria tuberocauda]|nr:glutamine amidotransferase [Wolbachia endosymbiont of Cruorifilaria tuberocauda]
MLLFSNISHANSSKSLPPVNRGIVVGLLEIDEKTHLREVDLSKHIYKVFNDWGIKTVLIDYGKIITHKKIQEELFSPAKQGQDEVSAGNHLVLDEVKVKVEEFIEEQKINRILISGNYCNLCSKFFSHTSCSQVVTEAIMRIVDNNPAIHLLGICGSLRNIVNTKGVEVVNVDSLAVKEGKVSRSKSVPNLQQKNIPLKQIKIIPNSRLAKVVAKFLPPDENGWFSIYLPDTDSGEVSNTSENRRKLELLGYKVAAFSSNGVIEAIEDKYSNIFFRSHPEALIVESGKSFYLLNHKAYQVSTLVAMAIINDFLYRA